MSELPPSPPYRAIIPLFHSILCYKMLMRLSLCHRREKLQAKKAQAMQRQQEEADRAAASHASARMRQIQQEQAAAAAAALSPHTVAAHPAMLAALRAAKAKAMISVGRNPEGGSRR